MKKDTQRMLPVIRVDMEAPLIECYVDAGGRSVFKYVARAGKAAYYGRTMEMQKAKDRLENALKEAIRNFPKYISAKTVRVGLNPAMSAFQEFFRLYSVSSLPEYDVTQKTQGSYPEEIYNEMTKLIADSVGLMSTFNTGKTDSPVIPTLVVYYTGLVNALQKAEPPTAMSFTNPRFVVPPLSFYCPVLLRTP